MTNLRDLVPLNSRAELSADTQAVACSLMTLEEKENAIWEEHLKAHWGPWKIFHALKGKGMKIPFYLVNKTVDQCEVCAHFKDARPRSKLRPLMYSINAGEIVYADVIGPLPPGRGGVQHIQCIVDSATRLAATTKMKRTESSNIIKGFEKWVKERGPFKVLITDNAAYYRSEEMNDWCEKNQVEHRYIAPYRHQSLGLVERFHRTLEDRVRRLTLAHGKVWSDHVEKAVKSYNEAVHSTTGFTPNELWNGTPDMRELARERSNTRRQIESRSRRAYPVKFSTGMNVLVHISPELRKGKLGPSWKGVYVLEERLSNSMWKARKLSETGGRGRRPIEIFHEDQLQPFEL